MHVFRKLKKGPAGMRRRRLLDHNGGTCLKWCNCKRKSVAVQSILLGIIALQLCMCQAGKVLVLTTPLGVSHIMNLREIAEHLSQQRAHQITVSSLSVNYIIIKRHQQARILNLGMLLTPVCSAVYHHEP
jgi:hypothetical protein